MTSANSESSRIKLAGMETKGQETVRVVLLLSVLAASTGCTSLALKRATLSLAESSGDLRYKEVMENLAIIASNPDMIPSYCSIFAGSADINDTVKATSISVWARTALQKPARYTTFFSQQTADFTGMRSSKSNWTLDPAIVPEKLRAIRGACRWAVYGQENVGADLNYLKSGAGARALPPAERVGDKDALLPGYYFDVVDRLNRLPRGWVHRADHRIDIPHHASYWAGCNGKYVWVGPEEIPYLSELSLVLQKIARADLEASYFPKAHTRQIDHVFTIPGTNSVAKATFFIDDYGFLTAGDGIAALPRKKREDNVGNNSELRSVINASVKSPQ
jgi:hypothetical protein